LSKWSR
jgi:hypothetical protein